LFCIWPGLHSTVWSALRTLKVSHSPRAFSCFKHAFVLPVPRISYGFQKCSLVFCAVPSKPLHPSAVSTLTRPQLPEAALRPCAECDSAGRGSFYFSGSVFFNYRRSKVVFGHRVVVRRERDRQRNTQRQGDRRDRD
jgi:hypothetical protein